MRFCYTRVQLCHMKGAADHSDSARPSSALIASSPTVPIRPSIVKVSFGLRLSETEQVFLFIVYISLHHAGRACHTEAEESVLHEEQQIQEVSNCGGFVQYV